MRQIQLTNYNCPALVSEEDFEELNKYSWYAIHIHNTTYAATGSTSDASFCFMHIKILGYKTGFEIEHKNGYGLNNCRPNLQHTILSATSFLPIHKT